MNTDEKPRSSGSEQATQESEVSQGGQSLDVGLPASAPPGGTDARDAGRVRESGGIHAMYGAPFTPPDEDEVDAGGFHALYGMPPVP